MATEEKPRNIALQVFVGLFLFFVVLPIATCAMCTGGGLLAIGGGSAASRSNASQAAICRYAWKRAQVIAVAVETFRSEHNGDCPPSLPDLVLGKYLGSDPIDHWGRPFRASCPPKGSAEAVSAWSLGPDGIEGDADDVRGWLSMEEACGR